MTSPIGARRVRTDLHTSENFFLQSTHSPRTLSPPNVLRSNPRRCEATYHMPRSSKKQYNHNSNQYVYSSSCPPEPSPISSHLPARATRLLNRSRLQQQAQLNTGGSDSPKSSDSFHNRKPPSSRSSSAHLSNRDTNSSSDDLLLYDKSFRNSMIQDVLYFKKQLMRLRRILQEDEECLQRTDTLNPFEVNNGQFFASSIIGSGISGNGGELQQQTDNEKNIGSLQSLTSIDDPVQELTDLRRQVVYLQGQVDDRDRTIRFQKNLIEKLEIENERSQTISASTSISEKEVVNSATQTERVRPLSIGQEGLARSKPHYTSYTINLPISSSKTTEIFSPIINNHQTSRRHTVISTTFTNLNHISPIDSPRRASIPWEKITYKPVKTTVIGEPIEINSSKSTAINNSNNDRSKSKSNNNLNISNSNKSNNNKNTEDSNDICTKNGKINYQNNSMEANNHHKEILQQHQPIEQTILLRNNNNSYSNKNKINANEKLLKFYKNDRNEENFINNSDSIKCNLRNININNNTNTNLTTTNKNSFDVLSQKPDNINAATIV